MKRSTAREIAIQLSFAAAAANLEPGELFERFFDEEYYKSLASEQELFAEYPDPKQMEYIKRLTVLTAENRSEIDGFIERYAKGWRVERISRTALAILRCAICEILYVEDVPESVAINEAVELTKRFAEEDSGSFVNGILGKYVKDMKEQSKSDE